jgi:hypothetical protein
MNLFSVFRRHPWSRALLRYIRVQTKAELFERIYKGIEEMNQEPVVFRWRYKMDEIAPA